MNEIFIIKTHDLQIAKKIFFELKATKTHDRFRLEEDKKLIRLFMFS